MFFIDTDNEPLEKGVSINGEVVVGNMTIVSSRCVPTGHTFLLYQSFISSNLNCSGLTGGFLFDEWKKVNISDYSIKPMEYVSFGASGTDEKSSLLLLVPQLFESGIIDDKDYAGIFFNREFAVDHYRYDMSDEKEEYVSAYCENYAYSKLISDKNLKVLLTHLNQFDYYNLAVHNCSEVAVNAWNLVFPQEKFRYRVFPDSLYLDIRDKKYSYTCNMMDILKNQSSEI